VVLPPQRRRRPSPYTGNVLKEKADSWHHSVSPSSHQVRLDLLLNALKCLADARLGGGFGPREPAPLADRPPHGGGASYSRDERSGQPYGVGAFAVAARPIPPGIRGHESEACCQPQGRVAQLRRPLVFRHAPRRSTGKLTSPFLLVPRDVLVLTVKIRRPSHEFTFGVGTSSIPYPLVLTPVV
jgi:hypothetical protein